MSNGKTQNLRKLMTSLRSQKMYEYIAELGRNMRVMDYGCGPGYGTAIIAKKAKEVVGVDISEEALEYAKSHYALPNVKFIKIDTHPTEFPENSFDIIVSSHVIEHIDNVKKYLLQLKRILRKGGMLIITTPNKKFRLLPFQKPYDPHHKREYNSKDLEKEISPLFNKFEIKGIYGPNEMNKIETNMMRSVNNPFMAYIRNPIMFILNKILPSKFILLIKSLEKSLINRIKKTNMVLTTEFEIKNQYSIDDIIIGDEVNKSIDFFTICYKI